MIRKVSFAAFALLSCTAFAAESDKRIRTVDYSSEQIVQIIGRDGIQSTIEFAPDERIENVAVGDSSKWQVTPNRHASLLFVKPLAPRSRTNMTVVTDRRTYMFDLVAGDKWTTPVYALKFSYLHEKPIELPKPVQQVAAAPPPPQPSPQAKAIATAEKLDFGWKSKGTDKLLPAHVFDDGASLYLAWDKDVPLPAILTMTEDRKEGPLNYRMSGDYIVISPIPANVVLRYGRRFAELWPDHAIDPHASPTEGPAAERIAGAPTQPLVAQPEPVQAAPQSAPPPSAGTVKVADLTSLYSDKLTDARHER